MLNRIFAANSMTQVGYLLVVSLLIIYAWLPITRFALEGLGFLYMSKNVQENLWSLGNLSNFNVGAVALARFLPTILGLNNSLYFWVIIATVLVINILFFYLVYAITKSNLISAYGALMLSTSYFGSIDMLASGIYAYFLERVPIMLFLVPSFVFLHLFLDSKKKSYLLLSLGMYFLGIGIGHWGVLFTGSYFFYPFFWYLLNTKNIGLNGLVRYSLYSLLFLGITGFFVYIQYQGAGGGPGPYWTFREFVLDPIKYQYPQQMLRQLVYWSSYPPVFEIFKHGYPLYPPSPLYFFVTVKESVYYTPHITMVYILVFIWTYTKLPKFRGLLVTIFFAIASMFFLNAYFGRYDIMSQSGSNRYLYLPSYMLVLFWSLFLWSIYNVKRRIVRIIPVLFIIVYYLINTWLIRDALSWKLEKYEITNLIWQHLIISRPNQITGTVFLLPHKYTDSDLAAYLTGQIGSGDVEYVINPSKYEDFTDKYKRIIEVNYDQKCHCIIEKVI